MTGEVEADHGWNSKDVANILDESFSFSIGNKAVDDEAAADQHIEEDGAKEETAEETAEEIKQTPRSLN